MMGLKAEDAARRSQEAGADVVGANCGDGPPAILAALEQMRAATNLPLLAKSNAGVPQAGEGGEAVWDVTPEQMVAHARTFVALGARVVGGCCGTTPAFIAAISAALRT
jgi:methionine synthase I (cobalamin-dependent)